MSERSAATRQDLIAEPVIPVTTPEEPVATPRRGSAWLVARLPTSARLGLPVFAVSLALFLVRFLLPSPVGQADNRDGPRLMCNMGLGPADPVKHRRYFDYAYFGYVPSQAACAGRHLYLSSELVPLQLAKVLTPVFGLKSPSFQAASTAFTARCFGWCSPCWLAAPEVFGPQGVGKVLGGLMRGLVADRSYPTFISVADFRGL